MIKYLFAVVLVAATALPAALAPAATPGINPDLMAGRVARLQGNAVAMQNALPRVLAVGHEVFVGDVISTGPDSRIEIVMLDDGLLTLGDRAVFVVIDYTAGGDGGHGSMRLLQGAFKAVSGQIVAQGGPMEILTDLATIGIRGTTVWGGNLGGVFQVMLIEGTAVDITTQAGRVRLDKAGHGTIVGGRSLAPAAPKIWPASKIALAVQSIAFK